MDELICRSLHGRTSEAEDGQLLAWRRASRANESYYRDLVRLLETAETVAWDVAPPAPPSLAALIPRKERMRLRLSRHKFQSTRGALLWGGGISVAAAAAIAAVLLGVFMPGSGREPQFAFGAGEFVTGPSETATVVLGDGTVVRLAPESRLQIPGVLGSREVILDGQAYFAVAKMEGHPFHVRTQAGEARVLGTRFEIRTHGDDLRLVVMEGRVALGTGGKQVEVGAGEVSQVSGGTTTAPAKVEDVRPLTPWLERFIVFQATPLPEVARELEREYGVRIELVDGAFSHQTITGWYADRSFEEVFAVVCGVLRATCSVEDGVATIAS